jgi:hypothetical protein
MTPRMPASAIAEQEETIRQNAQDAAITRAIITMADSLGVQVVAEGVETRAQLEFLDALGCTTMQGFLLSRPVDGAAIAELLRARRAVPAADLTAEELEIEGIPTTCGLAIDVLRSREFRGGDYSTSYLAEMEGRLPSMVPA